MGDARQELLPDDDDYFCRCGEDPQVVLVDGDRFIEDYEASYNLYRNVSHLNEEGNRRLAELIAESILEQEP